MADDTYSRGYRNDPPGRRETGAAGSEVDPLTELARLIGQSDPFTALDQRRPASRDPAPNAPSRDRAGYDDHARHPVHDAHYGAERRDYPADDNQQVPTDQGYGYEHGHDSRSNTDQSYESDRVGHDDGAGYDADPHGHPDNRFYDDQPPAPRRRGRMRTAAALIGLAIFGAALAFGYRAVFTSGTPPLIARDRGPNKIIPSSQTAEVRSTKGDDRITPGDQSERMVSHEERPIALPDGTRSAPGFGQSSAATLLPPMQATAPSGGATGGPAAPDNGAPRKVQTVTIPAEGAAPVPAPAPPRPPAPRATAAQAPAQPTPLQITPRPAATPTPPPQPGPGGPIPPSSQVATAAPLPPRAAAARPEGASGYYVQVSAQRSEEEAQSSFRGIQEKYQDLLGGHEPVIRRKDLGSKGIFFGAQVGPFSRESAVQLCENLKSAGGSCMVQKN